jgi:hypothetical protein
VTAHRHRPLTLALPSGEFTISPLDVDVIVEAANSWGWNVSEQAARRPDNEPGDFPDAVAISRGLGRLLVTLVTAPSEITDAPVALDDEQIALLRQILAAMAPEQQPPLSDRLQKLKDALSPS